MEKWKTFLEMFLPKVFPVDNFTSFCFPAAAAAAALRKENSSGSLINLPRFDEHTQQRVQCNKDDAFRKAFSLEELLHTAKACCV